MAVVTSGIAGPTSVGTVTDLTSAEVLDVQHRSPVAEDDVIDLYAWFDDERHVPHTLVRNVKE